MANPQPNKFIRISTELWEAFGRIRIPGEAWQVLNVIIRKTYGFRKKSDYIALSQITDATGINRQNVSRAVKKLATMNIISVVKSDYNAPSLIGINKDYDAWNNAPKKVTTNVVKKDNTSPLASVVKKDSKCSQKRFQSVVNMETTIDNRNTNRKKPADLLNELKKKYPATLLLINFFTLTLDKKTRRRLAPKSTTEKINWVETLVRLNEKEDYAFWEIFDIIHFARVEDSEPDKSGFCWKKNLLTIPALYKKTNGARKIEKIRQSLPDDLEPPKGITELEYIEKEVKRYAEEIK